DIALGLVTFAETAQVDVVPSTDRRPAQAAVRSMQLRPGTGIGEAIFASLDALSAAGVIAPPNGAAPPGYALSPAPPAPRPPGDPPPARIVVMSDGETTAGRPN